MIKAVFFDLYHTLIHYHPHREEVLALNLSRCGVNAKEVNLKRAIIAGDEFVYKESARKSLGKRTEAEMQALWQEYQAVVLSEAGITPTSELVTGLVADTRQTTFERVLFGDVLPALTTLADQGFKLGLISNVDQDIGPLLDKLGIGSYLEVVLTSKEAGAVKPEPRIFHEAIRRAEVAPADTLYVGDQYQLDVLGARGAGLKALLLDREDNYPEVAAAEKIRGLDELQDIISLV